MFEELRKELKEIVEKYGLHPEVIDVNAKITDDDKSSEYVRLHYTYFKSNNLIQENKED